MTSIRAASIAMKIRQITHFNDYADHVTHLIQSLSQFRPDFILLPELSTFELVTMMNDMPTIGDLLNEISAYTDQYITLYRSLAIKESAYIIAGSQITKLKNRLYNIAYLFTPDGRVEMQPKLHTIPVLERPYITAGDNLSIFETEKGRIAIMICYDIEFPEPSRIAALRQADVLFIPSATIDEQGYWRVRHCAHARCIENQIYSVTSHLIGNTGKSGLSFWGKSAILTPCDKAFPIAGIASETQTNEESVSVSELEFDLLVQHRKKGLVQPLQDSRLDLLEKVLKLKRIMKISEIEEI